LKLQTISRFFGNSLGLLLVAAGVLAPLRLSADSLALNPSGPFQSYNGAGEIDGFAFTATLPVDVTGLGIFAGPSLTLPAGNFNVGLWTASGTLLASTAVTSTDPSQDSFYFHPITPISLSAGQDYVVGAQMGGGVQTYFGGAYTMADGLQYIGSRWVSSASLVMPTDYDGSASDPGYLGGNLLIGSATPEPSSTGLMVLGLFAILAGIAGRSRKRQATAESR
jgi:PEP-CTERM putative exosortase interaction domain